MKSEETYEKILQLISNASTAINSVKSLEQLRSERRFEDYFKHQEQHLRESWIALGVYSISAQLNYLSQILNISNQIVPDILPSREGIASFLEGFRNSKKEIIRVFENIIDHPNLVFWGYSELITME